MFWLFGGLGASTFCTGAPAALFSFCCCVPKICLTYTDKACLLFQGFCVLAMFGAKPRAAGHAAGSVAAAFDVSALLVGGGDAKLGRWFCVIGGSAAYEPRDGSMAATDHCASPTAMHIWL